MRRDTGFGARLWAFSVWALVIFFILNLLAMIASVVVNSFGTRWFGTWLPAGYTTRWYVFAWNEFRRSCW
jgi:putative spermidine/putrescine transport system permease protein